jgi:hypothetical protein
LLEKFVEMIVINEAIWALSYHRHGRITDEMAERARLARVSYAQTFLRAPRTASAARASPAG